jgi:hypothetical protein
VFEPYIVEFGVTDINILKLNFGGLSLGLKCESET